MVDGAPPVADGAAPVTSVIEAEDGWKEGREEGKKERGKEGRKEGGRERGGDGRSDGRSAGNVFHPRRLTINYNL